MTIGIQDARMNGIEWVQAEYDRLKEDLNRDPSYYNVISIALSELQQEQEQVGREQKQVEHIDGLLESVFTLGLFEAVEPKPKDAERLHEYDERRKEFYHIIYDYVKEQQESLIKVHNSEIAQKDEKIRSLTKQGMDTENQLEEARKELNEALNRNGELVSEISALEGELEGTTNQLQDSAARNIRLKEDLAEAKNKLEQATKPKEYTAPSESLADRVASLKVRSQKDSTPDEMVQRFLDRQANGGKVQIDLPSIGEPQGASFRNEANPANDATNEEPIQSEVDQFRQDESIPEIQQGTESGNSGDTTAPVGTLEEAFRRIGALEQAVFKQGAA